MMRLYRSEHDSVVYVELTEVARGDRMVRVFVVRHGQFLAELPECRLDYCADGTLTLCSLPGGHGKTRKSRCDGSSSIRNGFCHGWHWGSAERFARDVLAITDGTSKIRQRPIGVARGRIK